MQLHRGAMYGTLVEDAVTYDESADAESDLR